jgi:SHS2 domain-containing protein
MAKNTENAHGAPREAWWDHFVHGADIGVEGCGPTQESSFEQAALALTAVVTDPDRVEPLEKVEIACEEPEPELLLVDWLNALIYEMSARRMLFGRFDVSIEGDCLRGCAWGEMVDVTRHRPAVEVKGATYTGLAVTRSSAGLWSARCVVDV